jgi:hypothetical protein
MAGIVFFHFVTARKWFLGSGLAVVCHGRQSNFNLDNIFGRLCGLRAGIMAQGRPWSIDQIKR